VRDTKLGLLWLASGLALSVPIAAAVGALSGLFDLGTATTTWQALAGGAVFIVGAFLSWFFVLSPLLVAVCLLWPPIARRLPAIERAVTLPIATLLAAGLCTLVVWFVILGRGTDPVALVFPFLSAWVPLLLPRLVVRQLRGGAFARAAA